MEFIPYILEHRTREIIEFMKGEDSLRLAVMHGVLDVIANYTSPNTEVTWLATASFRKIKDLLGDEDPYRYLKNIEIEESRRLYERYVKPLLNDRKGIDALLMIASASILGDSIRAMGKYLVNIESMFGSLNHYNLDRQAFQEMLTLISSKKVGFVLNNAGGVIFDLEFARRLAIEYDSVVKVFVKTGAYADDITYAELTSNFMIPDEVHVVPLNTDAAGIDKSLLRKSDLDELNNNDVIIAKGIMNYCGLHNKVVSKPAYSLMMVPYPEIAEKIGVSVSNPVLIKL